jgi:excisionase family DNA binding protein
VTVKQAAIRLEVSPSLVYGLIGSGKLRYCRIGNGRGVIRISEEHLAAYLTEAERAHAPRVVHPVQRRKLKHIFLP